MRMNDAIPSGSFSTAQPLYAQIAEQFAERIRSGVLRPGDKLPSQTLLMKDYGVSQATVRQALLNLSNQGLVVARQGKGVFVAEPRIGVTLGPAAGDGSTFDHEPVGTDLIAAPDRVAKLLDIAPGDNLVRARRRVLQFGRVVGLETFNLPFNVMQSVPASVLERGDPRGFLAQSAGGVRHATFKISASQITDFDAEILDVARDSLVLQREDVSSTADLRPVLMSRAVFLADLVSLEGALTIGSGQ